MNKLDNLRPIELSHEEAVSNGKKGGMASVKARRKKKALRDTAKMFMNLPVGDKQKEILENMGVNSNDAVMQTMIIAKLVSDGAKGNIKADELLVKILGEMSEYDKKRFELEKQRLEIEKLKLEIEKQKMQLYSKNDDEQVVIINDTKDYSFE